MYLAITLTLLAISLWLLWQLTKWFVEKFSKPDYQTLEGKLEILKQTGRLRLVSSGVWKFKKPFPVMPKKELPQKPPDAPDPVEIIPHRIHIATHWNENGEFPGCLKVKGCESWLYTTCFDLPKN